MVGLLGVRKSEPFGKNTGEYITMQIRYGILFVSDLSTGGCSIIPISYGTPRTPIFSIYNENESNYKVDSISTTDIKITRTGASQTYFPNQAIALVLD